MSALAYPWTANEGPVEAVVVFRAGDRVVEKGGRHYLVRGEEMIEVEIRPLKT